MFWMPRSREVVDFELLTRQDSRSMVNLDLLHLSDLHFTTSCDGHAWTKAVSELPAHDQPTLLNTLTSDLVGLGVRPKLVIVSGDLLDRGSESGVEPAVRFLRALMNALSLSLEDRLFIVPGNHDVLRTTAMAALKTNDAYMLYDRTYELLFGQKPFPSGAPSYRRVAARYLEQLGVEIVGFNSCEDAT